MTIKTLERVMWRLRKTWPHNRYPTWRCLEKCIMKECGTDPKTYKNNRMALIKLGWIRSHSTSKFRVTDADITGDD